MIFRVMLLWVIGLLTIVPYSVYHLLFYAQRDEYAFLICMPLFWVFGFWGVVGPLITVWKIRSFMKAFEQAEQMQDVKDAYQKHLGDDVVIGIIARETRMPKFVARIIFRKVRARFEEKLESESTAEQQAE